MLKYWPMNRVTEITPSYVAFTDDKILIGDAAIGYLKILGIPFLVLTD
jgi:hypothetical protein